MSIQSFIKQQQLNLAKRRLESKLAKIIDITSGHAHAKVPAGHKFYDILYKKASKAIVEYKKEEAKLGFPASDYNEIVVGAPALEELEKLANGKPEGSKALTIIIGSMLAWWGGTILLALTHNLYVYITSFGVR